MSEESWISSPGSKAQWSEMSDFYFPSHCTKEKHGHAGSSLQCQRWCCVSRLCQDQADAATSCSSLVVGQPHVLVHHNSTSLSDMFVTSSSQLLAGFRLFVWIWAPVPEGGGGAWSLRCGSDRWSPDMVLTVYWSPAILIFEIRLCLAAVWREKE